ncbi:MAG: hypothetical protein K6E32_05375, partial [Lachnospiraceae bacterium]|nr:hypothetical protein [Lachnospiraceae bacterium]
MNKKHAKLSIYTIFRLAVVLVAALVCLKSVITDFGFDQAYTVAMSYRHLNGDRMLMEMWDPLQPSVFVTDILLFMYRLFVPSLTGVSIYLGICGTMLFGMAAALLYKEIKTVSNEFTAFLAAVFFIAFRAKMSLFPDYTSLSIFFSAMTFVNLVKFFKSGEKYRYLIISSCFLCLQVLAYPSTALVFVGII